MAAQAGDRAALDALLRRHYDRIYAVCRRMTGQDADAADAAQDAMIAIVRGLPRFDGRAAFGTWAYRIASNACIDELRRRKRRPDLGLPEGSTSACPRSSTSATTMARAPARR
jgi:RNA polymerase sigma-70 factor, ECF subfamily